MKNTHDKVKRKGKKQRKERRRHVSSHSHALPPRIGSDRHVSVSALRCTDVASLSFSSSDLGHENNSLSTLSTPRHALSPSQHSAANQKLPRLQVATKSDRKTLPSPPNKLILLSSRTNLSFFSSLWQERPSLRPLENKIQQVHRPHRRWATAGLP